MNHIFAMIVMIECKNLQTLMIMFAIVSVKGCNYRTNFWQMSKDDAINIMKNSDLKKSW